MTWTEKLSTIKDNVPKVYEAGRQSERDEFWDIYQEKGARTVYSSAFFQRWWTDDIYNPKYDITNCTYPSSMYQASRITDTKVKIILGEDASCSNMFYNCGKLKTIRYLYCSDTNTFPKTFHECHALENITFDGVIGNDISFKDSPLLTEESLLSIATHLKDGVVGTLTITLHPTSYNMLKNIMTKSFLDPSKTVDLYTYIEEKEWIISDGTDN